jgi:hypothetical protein
MFTDASYARSTGAHYISQQIHRTFTAPPRQISMSGARPLGGRRIMGHAPSTGQPAPTDGADSAFARGPRPAPGTTSPYRSESGCTRLSNRTSRVFGACDQAASREGEGRRCGNAWARPRGRTSSRLAKTCVGRRRRARSKGSRLHRMVEADRSVTNVKESRSVPVTIGMT